MEQFRTQLIELLVAADEAAQASAISADKAYAVTSDSYLASEDAYAKVAKVATMVLKLNRDMLPYTHPTK